MSTVGQVMNKSVASIRSDATVGEAIGFLTQHHTGAAPVVNHEGALIGMISELELLDVVFDPSLQDQPISRYMVTETQAVNPDVPLSRAAQLFALYAFRRLPVVENGKLVGILTRRDLMNHALRTTTLLADPLVELFSALGPELELAEEDGTATEMAGEVLLD